MGAARPFRQAGEMWCWQDSNLVVNPGQTSRGLIADRLFGRLPRPWRRVLDWALTIAVAIALVLIFEAEVAKPYRVPSSSMEPTLHCARPSRGCLAHYSDRVIALRIIYRFRGPRRGEIAVFNAPAGAASCGESGSLVFVKRVIGVPGEQVSERNGIVLVDGKRLENQYVPAKWRDHRTGTWPRLEHDQYFVIGDNRSASCDSRDWGPVQRSSFIGPASITYWPPNRISVRW
jgi:signal peptidase I